MVIQFLQLWSNFITFMVSITFMGDTTRTTTIIIIKYNNNNINIKNNKIIIILITRIVA